MRLEGPNWSCNVAAARLVEIASGFASRAGKAVCVCIGRQTGKIHLAQPSPFIALLYFCLQSKSCCQGTPFRWTCFPASCAILASGQKETARLEVLDCAQVTMAHACRATPCDRDPQEEEEAPREVFGLGSDTRVHVVCGCALVSLLLHCFDALIWLLRYGRGPAARRIEDTHQIEIDNDLLLGWWIVVAVRMVSVGNAFFVVGQPQVLG